jgi:UDP-3-O-[3-hydroxymyristoyl] glucosamine N-acyltransferase
VVTVGELIEKLGGELVCGQRETVITGVAEVANAGHLQLVFGESETASQAALQSAAGAAVVSHAVVAGGCRMAVVVAPQPRLWFALAARILARAKFDEGIHDAAVVALDATLGRHVSIGAGAVIESQTVIGDQTVIEAGAVIGRGVHVGKGCHVYPRAVIYPKTTLGDRVIVHAGAVLGADGFGYVRDKETGAYTQFPQQGRLVIEDDVEIGANTTIDRGALGETRIRRGTKIDNLVHIGHNCDIGEDVVIAAQTGISGSSTVGNGAVIAGQVGIGDHAHVGPGVILGGQAGVLSGKTVDTTGTVLWGTPAKPLREYLREIATVGRLARRKTKSPAED